MAMMRRNIKLSGSLAQPMARVRSEGKCVQGQAAEQHSSWGRDPEKYQGAVGKNKSCRQSGTQPDKQEEQQTPMSKNHSKHL